MREAARFWRLRVQTAASPQVRHLLCWLFIAGNEAVSYGARVITSVGAVWEAKDFLEPPWVEMHPAVGKRHEGSLADSGRNRHGIADCTP
jgi:hypothetical protein